MVEILLLQNMNQIVILHSPSWILGALFVLLFQEFQENTLNKKTLNIPSPVVLNVAFDFLSRVIFSKYELTREIHTRISGIDTEMFECESMMII